MDRKIFRVVFVNQDKVYEVFCRSVGQSDMYGFVEISQLVFGERTQLLVDPGEEKLKGEFEGVTRSYIPVHALIRIDEVEKEGVAKVYDHSGGTVSPFPLSPGPERK